MLVMLKEDSSMVKVPSAEVGMAGSISSKSTATRVVVVVVVVAVAAATKASGVTGTVPGNTTVLVTVPPFVARVMVTGISVWINC